MAYKPKSAVEDTTSNYIPKSAEPLVSVPAHTRKMPTRALAQAAGGLAGGLAGATLGQPQLGAGIGGAGAELLSQAGELGTTPGTPGAAYDPGAVLNAFSTQTGAEVGGRVLGKGLQAAGKGAMRLAMKVTPEVAQTALQEGITATRAGLDKLLSKIKQVGGAEMAIVRQAAGQGQGWTDPQQFARAVFANVSSKLKGAPSSEIGKATDLMDEFLRDNPQRISPADLLSKRRYYDQVASGLQKQVAMGARPKGSVEQLWNKAVADEARQTLRTSIPAINDPSAYEKLTGSAVTPSQLQNLRDALQPLTKKQQGLVGRFASRAGYPAAAGVAGAMLPGDYTHRMEHGIAAAGLVAALSHPPLMSTLGIAAQNPLLAIALGQIPRAGVAVQQASE